MTVYKVVRCIVPYGVSYRTVCRAVRCIVLLFTTPIFLTLLLIPSFDTCNARSIVFMYDWAS